MKPAVLGMQMATEGCLAYAVEPKQKDTREFAGLHVRPSMQGLVPDGHRIVWPEYVFGLQECMTRVLKVVASIEFLQGGSDQCHSTSSMPRLRWRRKSLRHLREVVRVVGLHAVIFPPRNEGATAE